MVPVTREVLDLIDRALAEDLAYSDITTQALVPPAVRGSGVLRSKGRGVLAGVDVALAVFTRVDPGLSVSPLLQDSAALSPGDSIAQVDGSAASILTAERTALNFLQRMSGIATATSHYVRAVEGTRARIVDTRKTAPGMRYLDKYAVRAGGGSNHRRTLGDGVLVKDNHIAALRSQGLDLRQVVGLALERAPHTVKVEVEVTSLDELDEALDGGAHIVMLDNMSLEDMRLGAEAARGRVLLEASGGVNLETVRAVAETGVDLISVGSLTHSVQALDISLDLEF